MPLRAIYDIAVLIDRFRNVDLLQKGIYKI